MDGSMAGESKRDRMIIDHDIEEDEHKNEDFLTGERSVIIIRNKEKVIIINGKAFNTCRIKDISIGKNTYIFASAFYHCRIKRFTIQFDAPPPTETIFWQCYIETLIVQQNKKDVKGGRELVERLISKKDKKTRIDNIVLVYHEGPTPIRRALRMTHIRRALRM